tara:strand:- start:31 stop:249 length:219 start_codon:yes stop_codon:yes gene_type:complete
MKSMAVVGVLYIGVVDSIHGNFASVEITMAKEDSVSLDIPVQMIPCEIEEGSMFYFENIDGVTEIRCGEPPL